MEGSRLGETREKRNAKGGGEGLKRENTHAAGSERHTRAGGGKRMQNAKVFCSLLLLKGKLTRKLNYPVLSLCFIMLTVA